MRHLLRRVLPEGQLQHASCVAARAVERADDVPAVHDGDAVAHAEDLGQFGRDHEDRQPSRGELAHEPVDLGLRADVHALGRLVEDQDRRLAASQRASATFCWLPPDRLPTGRVDRRRLDAERATKSVASSRSRREVDQAAARRSARRIASVTLAATDISEDHAVAAAVFGDVGDAEVAPPRPGRVDGDGPPSQQDLPGVGGREAEEDAGQLGAARADQSGEAEDLAGADGRGSTPRTPDARQPRPRSLQHDVADAARSTFGKTAVSSRPTIRRISSARSTSAIGRVPTQRAVAQHRHAVGDCGELLEPVRDVDHADALGRRSRMTRKRFSTSRSESEAVGSSMMRILASRAERAGDLDELLLGHREVADDGVGVDRRRRRGRAARRRAAGRSRQRIDAARRRRAPGRGRCSRRR